MDEITKQIQEHNARFRQGIADGFYNKDEVMSDDSNITKGENPFDKAAKEADLEKGNQNESTGAEQNQMEVDIQKSDLMDALSYSPDIKITKTGKEIKEQVEKVVLPELNSTLAAKEAMVSGVLEDCGAAPIGVVPTYWTGGIKMDVGHNIFTWDQLCVNKVGDVSSSFVASEAEANKASRELGADTPEQADARRKYNDLINVIANIKTDIKCAEYLTGIKENREFELSPRQLAVLKF